MPLESILVTFEVTGLRFGGSGVPRGDSGAQGRPRDEKYSKSDLADPPPGTKLEPKIHTFLIFLMFFSTSFSNPQKLDKRAENGAPRAPKYLQKEVKMETF